MGATLEKPAVTKKETEREADLKRTLRVVKAVSRMAGRDIPIRTVENTGAIDYRPGVYILEEARTSERDITDTNFDLRPTWLSGLADSAHIVIAGDLTIDYAGGQQQQIEVAAKSYQKRTLEDRLHRAQTEIAIMEEMQTQGELSMRPIALAVTSEDSPAEGSVVLITEYDPALLSLDNYPWARGMVTKNQRKALSAVRALSRFNRGGILHGDAKIKNVAQDQTGNLGMIDYETSQRLDTRDPARVGETVLKDFGMLVESLVSKKFFVREKDDPSSLNRVSLGFIDVMAERYAEQWENASDEVQDAVLTSLVESTKHLRPELVDTSGGGSRATKNIGKTGITGARS